MTNEVRVRELGRRRSRLLARERKLQSPSPTGTDIQHVRLDSGFAYWERDVLTEGDPPVDVPYRQEIVRRPIDASAPATQLDRTGRLYVDPSPETHAGGTYDQLARFAVSDDRIYYTYPVNGAFIGQVAGTPVFR